MGLTICKEHLCVPVGFSELFGILWTYSYTIKLLMNWNYLTKIKQTNSDCNEIYDLFGKISLWISLKQQSVNWDELFKTRVKQNCVSQDLKRWVYMVLVPDVGNVWGIIIITVPSGWLLKQYYLSPSSQLITNVSVVSCCL